MAQRYLPHTVLCAPLAGHIIQYVWEMGIIEGGHVDFDVSGLSTGGDTQCSALLGFFLFFSLFFSLVLFQMTGSHSTGKAQFSISYRLFKQSFPRGTSDLNS